MVKQVSILNTQETVAVDSDRLNELYVQLGAAGAEDMVGRAMEELAVRLSHTERLYRQRKPADLLRSLSALMVIAEQVGMPGLLQVAVNVRDCVDAGDDVALAATLARLLRVGERSLLAIWDMQDLTI